MTLCDEREPFSLVRLTDENLSRLLPIYRDAHFHILEVWRDGSGDFKDRILDDSVWERLRSVERELSGISMLAVMSKVRTILGDGSHPTIDLDNACRDSFENGLESVRLTDSENELELLKLAVNKIHELGGLPDAALRILEETVEEKEEVIEEEPHKGFFSRWFSTAPTESEIKECLYGDEYYVRHAVELEQSGAKIITVDDISGLLTPSRIFSLMPKLKISVKVPVDLYVPSIRPELALANTVMAIIKGVDIIDTSIWGYGGPLGGPAIELVSYFCEKLGIELAVDLKAVDELRKVMREISTGSPRNEIDNIPLELEPEFDRAITAAGINDEPTLLESCRKIVTFFGF